MNTNIIQTNKNEIVAVDNYNPDFGNIRNIEVDGQVWLCGLDVCEALGYVNSRNAIKYHVTKEAGVEKFYVRSHGQMREMTFIDSRGFYDLCIGSTFPSALDIKDWIKAKFFAVVENKNLPAATVDELVNDDTFIEAVSDKVVDFLSEDAVKYRAMKGSKSLLSMKEIADTLALPGIGRTNLFKILRKKEMIND
ncbi:MAG: Bro-N domain-containing protein, partial [Bacilli bacterium]|nr:Bro-N domain-containing protein [Bacilli bacterium]